jgi:voltage-gated potassium channel
MRPRTVPLAYFLPECAVMSAHESVTARPARSGSRAVSRREVRRNRGELQRRIARWLDLPLSVLALLMLGLLIADYALSLTPAWQVRVDEAENAIWVIFAADFVIELTLAPSKIDYLKHNWLTAISVVLPAFRAVRILRAAQLLRGLSLARLLLTFNRGSRALARVARRGQLGYVVALTAVAAICGGAGAYYFERGQPGASIQSVWDGLWWAATLVTTINSGYGVNTLEGRIIGLLLRVFALGATGYLTAVLAAYLVGQQKEPKREAQRSQDELLSLRAEVTEMRGLLEELLERQAAGAAAAEAPAGGSAQQP